MHPDLFKIRQLLSGLALFPGQVCQLELHERDVQSQRRHLHHAGYALHLDLGVRVRDVLAVVLLERRRPALGGLLKLREQFGLLGHAVLDALEPGKGLLPVGPLPFIHHGNQLGHAQDGLPKHVGVRGLQPQRLNVGRRRALLHAPLEHLIGVVRVLSEGFRPEVELINRRDQFAREQLGMVFGQFGGEERLKRSEYLVPDAALRALDLPALHEVGDARGGVVVEQLVRQLRGELAEKSEDSLCDYGHVRGSQSKVRMELRTATGFSEHLLAN